MVVAAGPNWFTGSPQHFVVGAIAAVVVYAVARSRWLALPEWLAFILAVTLVSTAELVLGLGRARDSLSPPFSGLTGSDERLA